MSRPLHDPLTLPEERAIEAAAAWFLRAQGGLSRQEEAELLQWLREAPEHAAAMDIVAGAWEASDEAARTRASPDLLRAQSLSLTRARAARPRRRRSGERGGRLWPAAAAAVALSIAVGLGLAWGALSSTAVYAAPRGEQLALALPDGTHVRLDAGTRLQVRFSPFRRLVRLDQGEAEFDIAKQSWRPFRLDADPVEVWDRGTRFTVRRRDGAVRVVLLQGGVDLYEAGSGRLRARLAPGQQATVGATGEVAVKAADVFSALAWREGQLVLDDAALSEALAEFRARTPVEITLADPSLGQLRVSGVYRVSDPVGFLNALGALYPVRWREVEPGRFELAGGG